MLYSTLLAVATLVVTSVVAVPVEKRDPMSDAEQLNYALALERGQAAFWRQGIQNYSSFDFFNSGFGDSFYRTIESQSAQNTRHVETLTAALEKLGQPAAPECLYDWSTLEGGTAWVLEARRISGKFQTCDVRDVVC